MFTSELIPNLSVTMPKVSAQAALARGIVTVPPAASLLK